MLTTTINPHGCTFATIPGMDPLADWLLGPGFADFTGSSQIPSSEETPLIPCMMRFERGYETRDLEGVMVVPRFGKEEVTWMEPGSVLTGFATPASFERLRENEQEPFRSLRLALNAMELGSPFRSPALTMAIADHGGLSPEEPAIGPPEDGWPDGTVLMAVIDDGIAFANDRFRRADGSSRVMCFWQQGTGPHSPTVPFGRELLQAEIDDLLQRWTRADAVEEAGLYAEAGLADFAAPGHKAAAWRAAHGTHVLDLAAGRAMAYDESRRPIIGVELPTRAVADTSFRLLAPMIDLAIEYILARALKLSVAGSPLPVVICLSYGMHAGPHDGTHPLETAFEQHIATYPGKLRIVLPAGNHHLERAHAIADFDQQDDVVELPLRLLPDDRTPSFVQVWLPHAGLEAPTADRVRLALIPPHGLGVTLLPPDIGEQHGPALEIRDAAGALVARACYRFMPAPTARGVFAIALQPTTRLRPEDATPGVAPAGLWRIRLHRVDPAFRGEVDVRIQRDDAPYGYPIRGRQPYFDDPAYARFDGRGRPLEADDAAEQTALGACPVKRRGSLNAIATGKSVIVAGGFRRRFENRAGPLAPYSPGEPVTAPAAGSLLADTRKPDAVLPSDDSLVQAGLLGAGTASGSRVAFTGTSVAAPQLASKLAEWLAAGDEAKRAKVRAVAMLSADGLGDTKRSGWGRIAPPPLNAVSR